MIAGLTAAAVVVPQAMAYAAIAGLPLVMGLYTALVPLVICRMTPNTFEAVSLLGKATLGQGGRIQLHQP